MTNTVIRFTPGQAQPPAVLSELHAELLNLDGLEAVSNFMLGLGLHPELVEFLSNRGDSSALGERKLREALIDYIDFDLRYGTNTTQFFSEALFIQLAKDNPTLFANPEQAGHAVRHRPCRTDSVVRGLNRAVDILENSYGISASNALLTDLGCGTGKVLAAAMSGTGDFSEKGVSFPFKRAVGVDLFRTVVEEAIINLRADALKIGLSKGGDVFDTNPSRATLNMKDGRIISLIFGDAATYTDYNGVNVVFMYNPFDADIMEQVERNLRKYGGKALVVYNKPKHEDIFRRNGWHEEHREMNSDPDKQLVILSHGFSAARTITPGLSTEISGPERVAA